MRTWTMHILCARPPVHQSRWSTCLLNAKQKSSSYSLIRLPVMLLDILRLSGCGDCHVDQEDRAVGEVLIHFFFARAGTVLAEVSRDRRKVAVKEDCDVTLVNTKSYHHRRSYPAHAASSVISTRDELATRNLVRLP